MPNGKTTRVYVPGGGIQIRTNGELGPVYIGWCDVPDDVLYTLQLMPGYEATDEAGRPLSGSLAASSFGDKVAVASSSMPAPDSSYARGEEFNTEVADADPRGIHSQAAIDAARSGERTGTQTLLEQVAELEEGGEVRSPVKGQQELSFTQRREIRDAVRMLQQHHENALASGNAPKGSRPALVTEENEAIADEFDEEFGGGSSGDLASTIAAHRKQADTEERSGSSARKSRSPAKSRKGAGAKKRAAAKRSARKRSARKSASETDSE